MILTLPNLDFINLHRFSGSTNTCIFILDAPQYTITSRIRVLAHNGMALRFQILTQIIYTQKFYFQVQNYESKQFHCIQFCIIRYLSILFRHGYTPKFVLSHLIATEIHPFLWKLSIWGIFNRRLFDAPNIYSYSSRAPAKNKLFLLISRIHFYCRIGRNLQKSP